jgi:hypothetical protein
MTFSGTITNINNALNGLVYTPTGSFTGTDTFTITTNDQGNAGSGGAQSDSDSVTINVQNTTLTTGLDTLTFTAGDNTVSAANNTLNNGDMITGGTGFDTLVVSGNQLASFTFGDGTGSTIGLSNFEWITLNDSNTGNHIDNVTFASSFHDNGTIIVAGNSLSGNAKLSLNATNSTNAFIVLGGGSSDTIVGGSGADILAGKGGSDTLTGNGGSDQFSLASNNGTIPDIITDFTPGGDVIGFLGGSGSGAVNFTTAGNVNGTALLAADFVAHSTISGASGLTSADDNKVVVITSSQSNVSTATISGATNDYVVVFNTASGHNQAEIWFDADWSNTSGRSQIATLNNVTAAEVAALTVGSFVVYDGSLLPAGVAGNPINLALTDPTADPIDTITVILTGVASGWSVNGGTDLGNGNWTVQTNAPGGLTITPLANFTGAALIQVAESWTNADGSSGVSTITDNVESYAPASPIFAISGDDNLTGSSGHDLLVFSQPIGHDVIYNFDTAADQIDLIGYAGFAGFGDIQAHTADDGAGNAVITLGDGQSITLQGVDASSLNSSDFVFDQTPVTENPGNMVISDGAILPLSGIIDNTGHIELNSSGNETDLQLIEHGITLQGGGHVDLSDSSENVITGTIADVTLTNVDNTISGAGHLGDGVMSLINQGTIIATGTNALDIDTGANTIVNSGMLEATGSGGLVIDSNLDNSGVLWANGANLTAHGTVTGSGSALIDGAATLEFGAASSANVTFDAGATGTLKLADSFDFSGIVSGASATNHLDLLDVAFGAGTTANYLENHDGTGGTLSVTDGAHTVNIALLGQYSAGSFATAADDTTGTLLTYKDHLV